MKNTMLGILFLIIIISALLFGAMKFAEAVHAMMNENAVRMEENVRF